MTLVVLAVTAATVFLAERNQRTNQQLVLDAQFQNQFRTFLALQETRSNVIAEKCRALSQSVRLRAALEERDLDDLHRNALTELHDIWSPEERPLPTSSAIRASFFRFFDAEGAILSTEHSTAEAAIDEELKGMREALRHLEDQNIGFLAATRGTESKALREVVLTRIRDWNGRNLGALAVGFPLSDFEASAHEEALRSGIWLNDRLYFDGLTSRDRELLRQRLDAALREPRANNFPAELEIGPHLVFYKALNPETQFAPAYQICLYSLAASIREAQTLRWKIITAGLVTLTCGFTASLFVARNLSKPVEQIVAGSVENLTLRKKAEQDLRVTNRELEKALEELKATQQQVIQQERLSAIGQMASGIAHDFNNTLTPILGFADLLLESDKLLSDKAEARRCLKLLRTSAKDAASVVSRLREFYRPIESDEEFPVVDLAKIAQQAVSLTEPKWRRQTQANGVHVEVATEINDTPFIAGQESALREVLTNLIFNAVDAMPNGGRITLQTAIEEEQAVIRVRDTGTGMSESVRQRCLEPFFSTKGEKGTGLGLSMVYGIIERHRGKLEIESQVGEGTTFIIRIPLAETTAAHSPMLSVVPRSRSSLNVLVVDDEPPVLEVLKAYLRTDGHTVATASSGREALEKFRRNNFDLVVLDRVMPEMTGDQTARFIKQVKHETPVVMLTGYGGAMESGATPSEAVDIVLNKPITLETLRQTVGKYLHAA